MLLQRNVHYAFAILFDHFLLDFKEKRTILVVDLLNSIAWIMFMYHQCLEIERRDNIKLL